MTKPSISRTATTGAAKVARNTTSNAAKTALAAPIPRGKLAPKVSRRNIGHRSAKTSPMAFVGDSYALVQKMREGIPSAMVVTVANGLDVSQDRLFEALRLPKSTMKSHIADKKPLGAAAGDRLYRVVKVIGRAESVLADHSAAVSWIKQANRALGGVAPLTLLDTEAGYDMVIDTLGQIEHGVY
jgi:putative toxin-antitoxin system antitoxin component (TIGR02293 family)